MSTPARSFAWISLSELVAAALALAVIGASLTSHARVTTSSSTPMQIEDTAID
jgi:hypothetical protein